MPSGILLLNKPVGIRSTDCVNRIKRALKEKVGHAGTLDSTACGLLIILVGSATRLSDSVMAFQKVYRTTVKLGEETDTADASGKVIFSAEANEVSEDQIDAILPQFEGEIMQSPPEISAIKVGGRPSHKIARSGKNENFSLPPRPVKVYSIKRSSPLIDCKFELNIRCGKGTYIRSIARDIGRVMGCGGHVVKLERLSIGRFLLDNAVGFESISDEKVLTENILTIHDISEYKE